MSDNTNNGFPVPEEPLTREEQYLSAIAGVTEKTEIPEKPLTRVEAYLDKIVENGGGGGGGGFTPTDAQLAAMNSGITAEDVEQISTNKNNISSLLPTIFSTPTIDNDGEEANLTIIYGGYFKVGNLTVITIRFTIDSTIIKGRWLFADLPTSANTSDLALGASFAPCQIIPIANGNATLCTLCKRSNNTVGIAIPSTASDMSMGTYLISGIYLSE